MPDYMTIGQRILLTLWVGTLWAIGYIAAPVLFNVIFDRFVAGGIAGKMFMAVNYLGLVCGALLLASLIYQAGAAWRRHWQVWALVAMLVLVAVMEFVLQPLMQALKMASPQGFTAGTPEAVIARLNEAVRRAAASPELRERLGSALGMALRTSSP
ncbi:MAG: DUF4149 domain-containing protein, partial [Gammaproteobacteria bacterium]